MTEEERKALIAVIPGGMTPERAVSQQGSVEAALEAYGAKPKAAKKKAKKKTTKK